MAKVVTVTQYQAEDGSLYMSEAECNAHDFKLKNGELISNAAEAYANTLGAIDRSRSIKINAATEFLAFYLPWVEAGSLPVERTVFDTPKPEVEAATAEAETAVEDAKTETVDAAEPAEQSVF